MTDLIDARQPSSGQKTGKEKKQKAKNWKPEETSWLVDQVSKKKHIIESKATNRGFRELNMKNNTWQDIAQSYNNKIGFTPRSVESIKAKWDNLKTDCKKKSDSLKKHLNKTGAAPDTKLALSALDERVSDVMNVVKSSLPNPFDDDSGCIKITYASSNSYDSDVEDDSNYKENDLIHELEDDSVAKVTDDKKLDDVIVIQQRQRAKCDDVDKFATPTPAKRRKLAKEDNEMEVWELQKQLIRQKMQSLEKKNQLMIERHHAYMDTLEHLRSVARPSYSTQSVGPVQLAMSCVKTLEQAGEIEIDELPYS